MNIVEVIQKAGLENVQVQSVAASLVKMLRRKQDSEITVATSHEMASAVGREAAGIPSTHYGLLLWIPRDSETKGPQ